MNSNVSNQPDDKESAGKLTLIFLAIIAVAISTHYWMLDLEYQLDDWVQLCDASDPARTPALLGGRAISGDKLAPQFVSFFRPLLHLSFLADVKLFGTNPRALHAISLFYHIITCLVFYLVIKRFQKFVDVGGEKKQGKFIAIAAALIFAGHPSCFGAVSWVTARGDVLATLLSLLSFWALIRWRDKPSNVRFSLVCFGCIAAIAAKEGAVVSPILLLLADILVLRPRRPATAQALKFGAPTILVAIPIVYTMARSAFFGQDASLYGGAARVINLEVFKSSLWSFAQSLSQVFGGSFDYAPDSSLFWMQVGVMSALGILLLNWVVRSKGGRYTALVILFFCFGLAMGPSMSVYPAASELVPSRLFYFGFPFVSLLIACALTGLISSQKILKVISVVVLIGSLGSWAYGGYHHARLQGEASHIIRTVRQELDARIVDINEISHIFIIAGLPHKIDKIPLYGVYMTDAFHRAFTDKPAVVFQTWDSDLDSDLRSVKLFERPESAQFLKWVPDGNDGGGRLVNLSLVLPGPTGYRPNISWPTNATELNLKKSIHPRDVPSFAIRFDQTPKEEFAIKIGLHDETGPYHRTLHWNPEKFGSAKQAFFVMTEVKDWIFKGAITKISVQAIGGQAPAIQSFDFDAAPPAIELVEPENKVFKLTDPEPTFAFKAPNPLPWYRIRTFYSDFEQSWTLPANKLKQPGGTFAFRLSNPGTFPTEPPIPWNEFKKIALRTLDQGATRELKIRFTIEGLVGQIDHNAPAQTKSPLRTFLIRR
ncbi:MAG: hypothetical protein ACI97A_001753 [Planctomycetota bacterium]|jgi:hypothetical protein